MELLAGEPHGCERLLIEACSRHSRQFAGRSQRVHVSNELAERRTDAGSIVFGGIRARNREEFQQPLLADDME